MKTPAGVIATALVAVLSACASTHGLAPQWSMERPDALQRSLDADLRARSIDLSISLARALGGGNI